MTGKGWRRTLACALTACLALTLRMPGAAAAGSEGKEKAWTRTEPGGAYVTTRLYCPDWDSMDWAQTQDLAARYADTKEPVPLTSEMYRGWVFATVPAEQAERPLEVYMGEPVRFEDEFVRWEGHPDLYDPPLGTDQLNVRGLLNGDGNGHLNGDHILSRAEAFALAARMLSLESAGDPGYPDVKPGDWYYETVSASRAAGLAAADRTFRPDDQVSRGEMTVLMYRALKAIGWLTAPEGTAADLDLTDAEEIPDWALEAYLALGTGLLVVDQVETGELDAEGFPVTEPRASWTTPCTREDAVEFVYNCLRLVPWYPTQTAIDWGFDAEMPVIDGSTSTLPCSQAVYNALFSNASRHPQYPVQNSKSFYSYDRLIRGEADILFASTNPTEDTAKKAEEAGVTLEKTPMALDGMVFFTNRDNPVDNLTMEQIRKIYVENAYDNWSQLGGPDAVFIPYCRNRDSGSQAQMEQFFLGDQEIHPDILRETTSVSMQSVLTDVWNAGKPGGEGPDGTSVPPTWALGYSIYYYYQNASMILLPDDALKLLKVEGVLPGDETLADGSYPLAGYNYTVVRGDSPENSLARRMAAFMLSEEGQECVVNAGFGRLPEKAEPSAQDR